MYNTEPKTKEQRDQEEIDRLNQAEVAKTADKMLSMCFYIMQKNKRKLDFIPDQKLTEHGRRNSDQEINNYNKVMDELSALVRKYQQNNPLNK